MHVNAVGFGKIVLKFQILVEKIFVDLNKVNLEVTFNPILADPTVLKFAVYLNKIFNLRVVYGISPSWTYVGISSLLRHSSDAERTVLIKHDPVSYISSTNYFLAPYI